MKFNLRKKSILSLIALKAVLLTVLVSCGGNSTPSAFLDGREELPLLGIPVSGGGLLVGSTDLRSSSGFIFSVGGAAVPIAPADGMVVEQSGTTVTIMHSGRLASRITNVQGLTARIGDRVNAGAPIAVGGAFIGSQFTYSVLLDGKPVCPWSFFTVTARSQIVALGGGGVVGQGVCTQ